MPDAQLKTYSYLRYGMVLVLALLGVSILIEHGAVGGACFETSISDYYYTPARAVFVSSLVTVGACLVIIRGASDPEDIALNLAGMLAPIVAFVPTDPPGTCRRLSAAEVQSASADIANNVQALLWVGLFSLLLGMIVTSRSWDGLTVRQRWMRVVGIGLAATVVAVTWLWFEGDRASFEGDATITAHYAAAFTMFVFFGFVVLFNALRWGRDDPPERAGAAKGFSIAYWSILGLMIVLPLGMWLYHTQVESWDHVVLWVEIVEIGLFAIFWLIQTADLLITRPQDPEPEPTG
jgi:hypothetical protein